jgi:hypothetical protein
MQSRQTGVKSSRPVSATPSKKPFAWVLVAMAVAGLGLAGCAHKETCETNADCEMSKDSNVCVSGTCHECKVDADCGPNWFCTGSHYCHRNATGS